MEDNKKPNFKVTPPVKPNLPSGVKLTNTVQSKPVKPTLQQKPITKFEKSNNKQNNTIVKQEKINKKTSTPKSKKAKVLTIVIAAVVFLSLLTSLVYFSFIKPTLPMDISIEFSTEFEFINNETSTPTQYKNVLPGDKIDISYVISSTVEEGQPTNDKDVYVRVVAYALCDNNYHGDVFEVIFQDDAWYTGKDGYCYYKGVLSANSSIDSIKYIQINEKLGSEFAGKTVTVQIIAEALQKGTGSVDTMWPTAPDEWKNQY